MVQRNDTEYNPRGHAYTWLKAYYHKVLPKYVESATLRHNGLYPTEHEWISQGLDLYDRWAETIIEPEPEVNTEFLKELVLYMYNSVRAMENGWIARRGNTNLPQGHAKEVATVDTPQDIEGDDSDYANEPISIFDGPQDDPAYEYFEEMSTVEARLATVRHKLTDAQYRFVLEYASGKYENMAEAVYAATGERDRKTYTKVLTGLRRSFKDMTPEELIETT